MEFRESAVETMVISPNFWRTKRILITGHTGFKGAWLALWLYRLGADIVGYALDPPTTPSMFEICAMSRRITSVKGDIRTLTDLQAVMNHYQTEIVFHLAAQALVRQSYRDPVATYATNVMGTVNILEACRMTDSVKAIVIVTSDKCYQNHEWVWGYREIDQLGGEDPYSSSKGCAELVTHAYLQSFFHLERYAEHHCAIATTRAGNVIGGGDWAAERLIPDCIRAFQKGEPVKIRSPQAIRPWQHVLEPLSGYLLLAQCLYQEGPLFNGAWNFGPPTSNARSIQWLVDYLTTHWGKGATWQYDAPPPTWHEANSLKLDCSQAETRLNWFPQWTLETALKQTISWYQAYDQQRNMFDLTLAQIVNYEQQMRDAEQTMRAR